MSTESGGLEALRPLCRVLLVGAALACSGAERDPAVTQGGGLVPVPTARGAAVSPTTYGIVTESGGTLVTPDGALQVTVPPGAVASPTELTITSIANTARGAVGGAFRLGPEGQTFAAPVTLTFRAPETYPTGTGLSGVAVEYQDARGYWRSVEPVVRSAGANTVTVTTDHFSDWALTWQTGIATAEGPILLQQSVGIPFTASGRATVYLQGDTTSDTTYLLTGTLTVPETIPNGDETCVPDQVTKTLPLNFAEIHKSDPPVFRWGVAVHWTLTCTATSGAVTTRLMPTTFDTMYINLTRCDGYYDAGQIAQRDHLSGTYTIDCAAEGAVTATWNLACVDQLECEPAECRVGVTACTDGIQSCVDAGPAPDGTPCGATGTGSCSSGVCIAPDVSSGSGT